MGLDMYLFKAGKVENIEANDYHNLYYRVMDLDVKKYDNNPMSIPLDLFEDFSLTSEILKNIKISDAGYFSLMDQVGYWRKANHIHKWFVENVQNGEDNCKSFYVTKEKMIQLVKTCEMVLEDFLKAPELLPTEKGFFFGGTEYDFYYLQDVNDTFDMLKEILKTTNFEKEVILYYANW